MRNRTHRTCRSWWWYAAIGFGALVAINVIGCGAASRDDGEAMTNGAAAAPVPNEGQADATQGASTIGEVDAILTEAGRALSQSQYEEAERLYEKVLAIDPHHPEAQRGVQTARAYLNRGSTLDEVAAEIKLRREAAIREFDQALKRADEARSEARFADARGLVLTGLATLDRHRDYLSGFEYDLRRERAQDMLAKIDRSRELYELANRGY